MTFIKITGARPIFEGWGGGNVISVGIGGGGIEGVGGVEGHGGGIRFGVDGTSL